MVFDKHLQNYCRMMPAKLRQVDSPAKCISNLHRLRKCGVPTGNNEHHANFEIQTSNFNILRSLSSDFVSCHGMQYKSKGDTKRQGYLQNFCRMPLGLLLLFLITLSAGCAHSLTNKTSTIKPNLRGGVEGHASCRGSCGPVLNSSGVEPDQIGRRSVEVAKRKSGTPLAGIKPGPRIYRYSFLIAEFESPEPRDVCLSDSVKSRRVCLETDRPWRANTRASTNLRKLTENPRGNKTISKARIPKVKGISK